MGEYQKVRGHWHSSYELRRDQRQHGERLAELLGYLRDVQGGCCERSTSVCSGALVLEPLVDRRDAGYDPNAWVAVCTGHRSLVERRADKVPDTTDQPLGDHVSKLGQFDGKDVIRTTIAVTNAGDGLSSAMKVEPELFHLGDKVYVVLECEVANVKFTPLSDDDQLLNRVHTLRAAGATIVEKDLVAAHLEAQALRIRKAKEAESGQLSMDDAVADDDAPGERADDDFNTATTATGVPPAPAAEVDGEQFVEDADGFAEPAPGFDVDEDARRAPDNVTSIRDAGAAKLAAASPAKKAPAKKAAPRKRAPAKKAAAKKAPAVRKPANL